MLESPAKQYAKHLQVPFSLRVSFLPRLKPKRLFVNRDVEVWPLTTAVGLASLQNGSGFSGTHWVFCRKPKPISTSRSIPMPPFIQNSVSAGQSLLWFLCHTHTYIYYIIHFVPMIGFWRSSFTAVAARSKAFKGFRVTCNNSSWGKRWQLTYLYLTNRKLLKLGSIANLRPVRLVPTQHPAFDLPTRKIMDVGVMQAATLDMSVHEHEYSRHWMPFFTVSR